MMIKYGSYNYIFDVGAKKKAPTGRLHEKYIFVSHTVEAAYCDHFRPVKK